MAQSQQIDLATAPLDQALDAYTENLAAARPVMAKIHNAEQGSGEWLALRQPLAKAEIIHGIHQRTPEWLAARRAGIGGSDAAAVLGLSPWRTPAEVFDEKIGTTLDAPISNEAMEWGTLLEPVILSEYQRRTGQSVAGTYGLLRSIERPWMLLSPDAITLEGRIVEIKTTRSGNGWGEPGTDEIPIHYLAQVHHALIVTGAPVCDIAVLIAGSDFRLYHVEADLALHADMIEQEEAFWRLVETRTPPAIVSVSDAVRRWGRAGRVGAVVAGREIVDLVEKLRDLRGGKAILEADEDKIKAQIMAALGETGDTLVDDGGHILATWKLDKGRNGYTVQPSAPSRRFLLKG